MSEEYQICAVCNSEKLLNIENFYYLALSSNNKIIKKLYITEICKSCLDWEDVKLINNKFSIFNYTITNKSKYKNLCMNNYLNSMGLKRSDVLTMEEAGLYLHKHGITATNNKTEVRKVIKKYVFYGILNRISIYNHISKQELFFLEIKDLDNLIKKCNNGYFSHTFFENKFSDENLQISLDQQFVFIREDGKIALYIDMTNQKQLCRYCGVIKGFSDFHNQSSQRSGKSQICKSCRGKSHKQKWELLSPEEKAKKIIYVKQWMKDNRDKIKIYEKKRNQNPKQRMYRNIRTRLKDFLKTRDCNFNKDIGCTKKELVEYLESKFQKGMSWDNYGAPKKEGDQCWHIDHIIILICSHYGLKII